MLSKRLIVCLDVREGKLAKSIKFVDTKDIGDPVAKARQYYQDGADELVFYDINASRANQDIKLKFVEAVAAQIFIPFSVGGGIRSIEDATKLRLAGAEKSMLILPLCSVKNLSRKFPPQLARRAPFFQWISRRQARLK